ncbi:MAG: DUF1646 domain-containing protein [Euryarchaeota archaeon]|nr:DUF1646 domain-containing protein [Euryarchaeota archaeon]
MAQSLILYLLLAILILILIMPVVSSKIEKNLEIFFLVMGVIASIISGSLNYNLFLEALESPVFIHGLPIGIFQVVLIAGLIFTKYMGNLESAIKKIEGKIGIPLLFSLFIFLLSIGSSVISAIVSSVIISEISRVFPVERKIKNTSLVLAAFSIGLGASLTPLGEPLSTILVLKLSGPPYRADFFFPMRLLFVYIFPLIILLAFISYYIMKKEKILSNEGNDFKRPTYMESILRAVKIYIFVFSLTLLGSSFTLIVENYIIGISPQLMYFFGLTSAFLDNATLTAAIITPSMSLLQIKSFLISLLISGGLLIPGNVPNIVIAYTHKISFKEWAKIAIPIGIPIFIIMFIIINI